MKWSEFFSSAITGAREAGIEIEADEPQGKTEDKPAAVVVDTSAADAERAAQGKALIEAQAEIAKLKADARTAKHSALASAWVGDKAGHLAMLATLEASPDQFAFYVTQQNSAAEIARQSALFSAAGSDRSGGGSAWEQIDSKARALMAEEKGLTLANARVRVAEENPTLYAQYKAEN